MNTLAKEFPSNEQLPPPIDVLDDVDEEDLDRESIAPSSTPLTDAHRALLNRLAPLQRVQLTLEKTLGAASSEEVHGGSSSAAPWTTGSKARPKEFAVTSRSGWKSALSRVRGGRGSMDVDDRARAQVRPATVC